MADFFYQFVRSRAWSIYPFVPPVFSLVLSILLIPLYDRVLDDNLRVFLRARSAEDKFKQINEILKGRALQIAYLTEIPVFVVSGLTTAQSNHPLLLMLIAGAALLVVLITSPRVFLSSPDYIAGTKLPEKLDDCWRGTGWFWRLVDKADLMQVTVYTILLAVLNVILIIVIAIALPSK